MAHSGGVYDLIVDILRGRPVAEDRAERTLASPVAVWKRVLDFEGCATHFDRSARAAGHHRMMSAELRRLLRDATASSMRLGMLAHRQLEEVAALSASSGIRVLALKGAAQLLAGQAPGVRSISDIDLMVGSTDAVHFHGLLTSAMGYVSSGPAYPHHLPVLSRPGSLSIDLHTRLSDAPVPLDASIWSGTRSVALDDHSLEIPSATSMVLHAIEHGLALNWMGRYRLRDVLDVATLYTPAVHDSTVRRYLAESSVRCAAETLLSAAHALEPRVPIFRDGAWSTIRRVSRTRLALAALPRNPRVAERWFRYAGLIAEGSPRSLLRATRSAARRVGARVSTAILEA